MATNNYSYDENDNWKYKPPKSDDNFGAILGFLFIVLVIISLISV